MQCRECAHKNRSMPRSGAPLCAMRSQKRLCMRENLHTKHGVETRCLRLVWGSLCSGPKARFTLGAGCGRDGMVDISDLKSEGRMPVWVRVPPPAPKIRNLQKLRQIFNKTQAKTGHSLLHLIATARFAKKPYPPGALHSPAPEPFISMDPSPIMHQHSNRII